MDLKGDELIAFGFKRIVEELQELRGALTEIRSALEGISGSAEEAAKSNTFMLNDTAMYMGSTLDKVQANTFTTELNTIQIGQALSKEDKHESELEGV